MSVVGPIGPYKIKSWAEAQQFTPPASQSSAPADIYTTDELIVKFRPGIDPNLGRISARFPNLANILTKFRVTAAAKFHPNNFIKNSAKASELGLEREYVLKFPKGSDIPRIVAELKTAGEVESAEPNYKVKAQAIPDDPSYPTQWWLPEINAPLAWNINTGSGPRVAVIGTGVDRTNGDMGPNTAINSGENPIPNGVDDDGNGYIDDIRFWNFVLNTNDTMDYNGHDTNVAGIIGAVTNNAMGTAGINWNAQIMPIKALDDSGVGTDAWTAAAIIYAADNGAKIINLSYGGYYYSQLVKDAVDYAYTSGCVMIASAGNDNTDAPMYPAALPHVLAVGGIAQSGVVAGFSNHGGYVDISAPAENIVTAGLGASIDSKTGTSYGAAIVSGAAALILSQNPTFTNDDIVQTLLTTARDKGAVGWDNYYGAGEVDLLAALSAGAPLKSTITSPAEDILVTGTININGNANGANFQSYTLEWGAGEAPTTWNTSGITLANGGTTQVTAGLLGTLNVSQITTFGFVTVKLTTISNTGKKFVYTLRLRNGAIIPGTVNDGTGPDTNYQSSADTISGNWSGFISPAPSFSNIAEYKVAIGTSQYGEQISTFASNSNGLSTTFSKAGLALASGTKYYVTVRAYNTKGEYIDVASNGVIVDTSVPTGTVNDGSGADIAAQASTSNFSGNWSVTDAQSGIKENEYSIGTTPGGTDVAGWTNVGTATNFSLTGLNLVPGQTYYTSVRATNNAGLISTFTSDGVRIDLPPSAIIPRSFNAFIKPNPFSLSRGKAKIQVELPVEGRVTIQIYSINNYRIAGLLNEEHKAAGIHEIEWEGATVMGQKVPEGIYLGAVIVRDNSGKNLYKKIVKIAVTK